MNNPRPTGFAETVSDDFPVFHPRSRAFLLAEQLERGKGKKKRQRAVGYISWLDGYV